MIILKANFRLVKMISPLYSFTMKKIKLDDFLNYNFLSSLKCSEDGVFFVVSKANADNGYDKNIYTYKEGKTKQLTFDNKATYFLPYKGSIYFIAERSEGDKKAKDEGETNIYSLPLSGGEASLFMRVKANISYFRFLPDGRLFVLASEDVRLKGVKGEERKKRAEEIKAYEEIETSPFYSNGNGFISGRRTFAAIVNKNGSIKELFDDNFAVSSVSVSEDESKLLLIGKVIKAKPNLYDEVRLYDGKDTKTLLSDGVLSVTNAFFLRDKVVLAASDMKSYGENQNPDFFLLEEGTFKPFATWGESMWSSVGSDCRLGGGSLNKVYNNAYYFVGTKRNSSNIVVLHEDGSITPASIGEGSTDSFDIAKDGTIYSIKLKNLALQELYKDDKCITSFNKKVLKGKYVASFNKVSYINDGVDLDGWVLLPKDYDKEKKYPAILDIHGGPKTVYGEVFVHEMQYWANEGYFVLFCNPRGSDGRGNEFMDIRGKYGTIDFSDIMAFVDAALSSYPAIDSERIGETGGSYGGYMSNWIMGHTNRFKAIATQRSIVNWISFWGTSDIGPDFAFDQNAADITAINALYERSPMKAIVTSASTPTLIIHSDEDYRCPVEQGYQLFNLLNWRGVETKMVLFHGENHELSRSGKPKNRVKRLFEITAWMDKYLKG